MNLIHPLRWIVAFCVCTPLLAQPVLEQLHPRGGRTGTAVRIVLSGKRLGPDPRLLSQAPVVATPLSGPSAAGQMPPRKLTYLLEVRRGARPGAYPVRVETSEGISNALLFTVHEFPQVTELESDPESESDAAANDLPETAQPVDVPVTVEGRLQGPERDMFRIEAREGQRLTVEVAARRAGSAIDPNLELLDASGLVVARSGDAPGLGLDSRLAFKVPDDSEYFIAVRDERFSTQDHDFYRLTIGEYGFAENVFPLGWTRGAKVLVEFSGGSLSGSLSGEVDLGQLSGHGGMTWVPVPGTPSTVPFLLGDGEEALEADSAGVLREGVVMNGRIAAPGESDRYRIAVASGERWAFELRSGELPSSALYGVMTISSEEQTLAIAGEHAGDPNPYVITSTGETATYPFVNLTVPPDVNEITVAVEDLLGRGGRAFAYRLAARKMNPDFLLSLNEPFVNIPRGGSAVVTVTAERRGYEGPIELYLESTPDDIEVSGGHIAPRSTLGNTLPRFESGRLTLSAKAGAELRRIDLVVRGRAAGEGHEGLDRRATGPGLRAAVKGVSQAAVTAEWLGYDLPARVNPEQPAYLEFLTPRRQRLVRGGSGLVARWAYHVRRPGVQVKKKVEIPRNTGSLRLRRVGDDAPESGEFRMFTHERTSLGMVNFNLSATVSADGREQAILSQPLEIEVVDGYGLEEPGGPLVVAAGGEGVWAGSIWRDPEFRRAVTVSAVDLPPGIRCDAAELDGAETAYELGCTAEPDAKAGGYQAEIRARSLLSDEGTTRYDVDPVQAGVTVRP